jgi:hypothetical protein
LSFSSVRQRQLTNGGRAGESAHACALNRLLSFYPDERNAGLVRKALLDPYFPLGALEQTLFADVNGMRFFISKRRPDLEPGLIDELRILCRTFLRIRADIETQYDSKTVTCVPLDGVKRELPTDQWCTFCGRCCHVGGIPAEPPPGIRYPDNWLPYLWGGEMENQQSCPFLLQHFGEPFFFCAIHNIKPLACRTFGESDCRIRLANPGLHSY